jgi:hypothetical protein
VSFESSPAASAAAPGAQPRLGGLTLLFAAGPGGTLVLMARTLTTSVPVAGVLLKLAVRLRVSRRWSTVVTPRTSTRYRIVANVGDQYSDLAGGHEDIGFKLTKPFYFLP